MKMWAGRFSGETSAAADSFQSSFPFDQRLYKQDILGSIAHARMLGRQGIISPAEAGQIVDGLTGILADIQSGALKMEGAYEDIHMFVEEILTSRIGAAGKKLHTGRSRNDQVALDMRMFTLDACAQTLSLLRALCDTLLMLAQKHTDDIMPGYTHMQRAQPVTLGHYLMAYCEMFLRDIGRFQNAKKACDSMPLGAGALAGTTYPLDRTYVAEQLGFSAVTNNSLDAVSDRDYQLEYLSAAAICMMHLSRFCEEMVLWSSAEFGFITMSDAFSTGSSMMPQKKNPDMAELIRGKTGRIYGNLTALLTVMKGLPMAYDKDMQEDKEAFFDASDTCQACLDIFRQMLESVLFNTKRMQDTALNGFANATDCADYLVGKGVPFRDAHFVTGQAVAYATQNQMSLLDIPLETYKRFSPAFEADVYDALALRRCVEARGVPGGPAQTQVALSIQNAKARLNAFFTE